MPEPPKVDRALETQIRAVIDQEPAVGLRMITARIRRAVDEPVNKKKIHCILTLNQGQCQRRPRGHRPRAHGWVSRASRPNDRWAIDTTHLFCGRHGWCHLTAIIDCYDRPIVGWRLVRSGIAGVAGAVLEEALRRRRIDLTTPGLVLRSDNGLDFGAKALVKGRSGSGSSASRAATTPSASWPTGSTSTTPTGRTRRWAISRQQSIGRK